MFSKSSRVKEQARVRISTARMTVQPELLLEVNLWPWRRRNQVLTQVSKYKNFTLAMRKATVPVVESAMGHQCERSIKA
jgi:hypothetical protein